MTTQTAAPSTTYDACAAFLFAEAEYLDDRRFTDWLACLSEDLVYEVPVRLTRSLTESGSDFSTRGFHMRENYETMRMRVARLSTEHAYAEDPPSRTMRQVSNVRVAMRGVNEASVKSKFLMYRSRGADTTYDLLAGERRDVLREMADGWKLVRREVLLAHTTIPTLNLAVFL
ncbi:aromatic-ring-hydroxylating dioxygenase subunit beta [Rhodococcus erythropolis]|uniref:aromatic-ring-hydroxylating dioxygenase subunit beta n=1 Tax=Rhodococcus erythropolis TaxID=1833 RepID=UPI001BE791AB|nr:aromatic-ring-hydroxylating dioxygenase subunit beta [Rhodococcus erythropolis]MBT2268992.1 aromatic-ring-hydroxylating dioxygenase subunit beta [Rhodococcus erythropolis]